MPNIITRNIPNGITSCNLFSGCIASYMAFQGDFRMAMLFIVLGAVFDFFDGMSARLLNVSSPIGKELDSLADNITFGLAPSAVVAKFNLDERQTTSFIGMPTPANALFWSSLAICISEGEYLQWFNALYLLLLVFVMSFLLVSELPMFSLKFKKLSWKTNKIKYIFLIVSISLLVLYGVNGLSAVILWYILLSVFLYKKI